MARNPLSPYRSGFFNLDPLSSLHREMNRLFDDVLGGLPAQDGPGGGVLDARTDVSETDEEIRVCAELPGVSEDDIDVNLQDDVLTIRGEKKFERKDEKENFHFVERSYGTFRRSIRLPAPVDPDRVQASFENGVLTVTLPKAPQAERTRRIAVRRGGDTGGGAADPGRADEPQG